MDYYWLENNHADIKAFLWIRANSDPGTTRPCCKTVIFCHSTLSLTLNQTLTALNLQKIPSVTFVGVIELARTYTCEVLMAGPDQVLQRKRRDESIGERCHDELLHGQHEVETSSF